MALIGDDWEREPISTKQTVILFSLVLLILFLFFDMKYEGIRWF